MMWRDAALPAATGTPPVAFDAEGKESAVGIGLTKLGTRDEEGELGRCCRSLESDHICGE